MTTPDFPTLPQFDTGPLSWVMVEIREALARSKTALFEAGGRAAEDQATQLQHARSHLHQAHGALQMVDLDGPTQLTRLAETALDRFKDGGLKCSTDHAQVVADAYQALVEYLQELLDGSQVQPLRLFPYYQALQQMLGAERIHPADLFYPSLQPAQAPGAAKTGASEVATDGAPAAAADYASHRASFEKSLLPYLRSTDLEQQQEHAEGLLAAVQAIAAMQTAAQAQTFWLAMQAFAELVATGKLAGSLYVKQLFGLINLQIRRLAQGNPSQPETMLRDALFFVASADTTLASDTVQQIRKGFALDGQVPANFEQKRYGRIDNGALAHAQAGMSKAKAAWDRLAASEHDPALEAGFSAALSDVARASEQLNLPALGALMRELSSVADHTAHAGRSDALALEIASTLLFAEHGLAQIRHLPGDFAAHADTLGARLHALASGATPPPTGQWQDGIAEHMQQDDTVVALAHELKNSLRQVEQTLDEFYADAGKRDKLQELDPVLHQLQGALAALDQEDATQAAQHVQATVAALAQGRSAGSDAATLEEVAQNLGALGFFLDMLGQNAAAARQRFAFDATLGRFRSVPFRKLAAVGSVPVLDQAVAAAPAPAPLQLLPPVAAPEVQPEASQAELLEIFVDEAQEVLRTVGAALVQAQDADEAALATLRRSFHTLKGSARMVALFQFADAAHAVERVLNSWLAEARPASAALLALLGLAHREMTVWVGELQASGVSALDGSAIIAAAARLQHGTPEHGVAVKSAGVAAAASDAAVAAGAEAEPEPEADTEAEAEAEAGVVAEAEAAAAPAVEPNTELEALEEAISPLAEVAIETQEMPVAATEDVVAPEPAAPVRPAPVVNGNVIEFPTIAAAAARDDNVKQVGELEIPLPLYNIYLHETDELVRLLAQDFGEWRHEPRRPVNPQALQAAHTLAGTSGTVGFAALRELAMALESTLEALLPPAPHLDQVQHDLLDFTIARIRQMLQSFAAAELPAAQPELIAALRDLAAQLAATPPAASPDIEARLDDLVADTMDSLNAQKPMDAALDKLFRDTFAEISASVREDAAGKTAEAPEMVKARGEDSIDDLFNAAFDDTFAEPPLRMAEPIALAPELEPIPQAEPEPAAVQQPEPAAEAETEPEAEPVVELVPQEAARVAEATEAASETAAGAQLEAEAETLTTEETVLEAVQAPASMQVVPAADTDSVEPPAPAVYTDELDADLLPVFLEEGADLLPQVGAALRAWQHEPEDKEPAQSLTRLLHTLKGSARMAGAMRLGQHVHEMETHIENMLHAGAATPHAFEELLTQYDYALLLFEQLHQPALAEGGSPASTDAPAEEEAQASGKAPMVRVRADILDRLVNQAGEVSISRSRLENEVSTLRTSLSDFSENLQRLQRQLREVEMQAESQIASRMSISGEREFDPLEFDRFTRLHELTRMMAESVNDVAAFHEGLERSVESAGDDLLHQARLTRELQHDLMRVRMVPFSSIAERLFRVARQSAKEVDKRVNLDIRGGEVEIDRSVLERMAAPFEHLVRNAIAHGVESRSARSAAGKQEVGELLVQVSQQGNEVVLEFSDDGAGLDLARIRAKGIENGLLAADATPGEAQLAQLIFTPGFSTASELTELSGRGVGMDVVQSEAQSLGGRVELATEAGKGARVTVHLPITLAVSQVVLVRAGGKSYAVPAVMVEQVAQLKEALLAEGQSHGSISLQGQQMAFDYLPALLGHAGPSAALRSAPVLMLRHGAERLALVVDEVQGNREVVVKNLGPQLARMVGISGATVLGSGEIVLILNPLALVQHLAQHPELRERYAQATQESTLPQVAAPSIMVVDDSLTVRRVTQRLLEREGYRVMLAKDGVDALEQMQAGVPDLMLVDIEMPRMDGFDLTRNVRGDERSRHVPIIMITSRSADKHRNLALELGVNAYFGKPYQEEVLLQAIAGLLEQNKVQAPE